VEEVKILKKIVEGMKESSPGSKMDGKVKRKS